MSVCVSVWPCCSAPASIALVCVCECVRLHVRMRVCACCRLTCFAAPPLLLCWHLSSLLCACVLAFLLSFLPPRLTKVVAEGHGQAGADSALRAAAHGMQDKASTVREAATALLAEMFGQLGQEAVVTAAGQLTSADKKAAQEAISKVLGSGAAGAAAAAAPAGARPGSAAAAAAAKAPAARPATRSAAGRPATARGAGVPTAAAAAAEPSEAAAILGYSDGKADRARKVGLTWLARLRCRLQGTATVHTASH